MSMAAAALRPLFTPENRPMRIAVFASGSGGNLQAALDVEREEPNLLTVALVITDRLGIRAIDIAQRHGVDVIARDFERECGNWLYCRNDPATAARYRSNAERFHDSILAAIEERQASTGYRLDLLVLAYHRWIHGRLLAAFRDRIINQHAGDLGARDAHGMRLYRGINPVLYALRAGEMRTRTSTILVGEGHDTGEILSQGPWVDYTRDRLTRRAARIHELIQKRESDWPSLRFALCGIARGRFAISNERHQDGSRTVYYDGLPLPYQGVDLATARVPVS
jgi:phosphoribosylglycinamide formyltransferase 1